ncbi:MAG TPA: hypothetical protein VJ783_20320 [Pirellulales bacterium]|nr:hypothetical protein [Pirellulales bacterium]
MSTITRVEAHSRRQGAGLHRRARYSRLQELWSDGLAMTAIVTLASFIVFQTLRMVLT